MAVMYFLKWQVYYSGGETGQNEIFTFEIKFDLEGQGQSYPKTIEISINVFFSSDPNLVIPT